MKLGIIRCMQTEDYCPGTADLKMVQERKGPFAGAEELELVGFVSCGAEDEAAFLSPGEVSPAEVPAAQRETGGEEERP